MKKIITFGLTAVVAVAVGFAAGELNSNAHHFVQNADGDVVVWGHHLEHHDGHGSCWDWCQQACPWIDSASRVEQTAVVPETPEVETAAPGTEALPQETVVQAPETPAVEAPADGAQAESQAAPEVPAAPTVEAPAPTSEPAQAPAYNDYPQENYDYAPQAPSNYDPGYNDYTPQYSGNGGGHHSGGHHGRGHH